MNKQEIIQAIQAGRKIEVITDPREIKSVLYIDDQPIELKYPLAVMIVLATEGHVMGHSDYRGGKMVHAFTPRLVESGVSHARMG